MSQSKPRSGNSQLIEQLANSIQIDELAERLGIPVKRIGKQAMAQCIFHNDTKPSMQLYTGTLQDKAHYHCFVCNSHGDIFELVKQRKGVSFIEAVRWLASSYGYSSTTSTVQPYRKQAQIDKTIPAPPTPDSQTLEDALSIYKSNSSAHFADWITNRGLSQEVCTTAELCFASRQILVRNIEKNPRKYGELRELLGKLLDTGLIKSEQRKAPERSLTTHLDLNNHYRDFFNDGRIIFPIRDSKGRLAGFAGRKIDEQSNAPKYLYSPNLPKASLLYRAHEAFQKVISNAKHNTPPILYICEGLVDALRLEGLGFSAVAVLGARLSEKQALLIIEIAKDLPILRPLQVRFFLDRDGPGLKGAAASIETLIKLDTEIKLELGFIWASDLDAKAESNTPLKDPDELLIKFSNQDQASILLEESTHPVAVALLADNLNIAPTEILNDSSWDAIPLGAKFRFATYLDRVSRGLISRVLETKTAKEKPNKKWAEDIAHYIKAPASNGAPLLKVHRGIPGKAALIFKKK